MSLIEKHVASTMSRSRSGSKKGGAPSRNNDSESPPPISTRSTHLMMGDDVDRNMRYALEKTNEGQHLAGSVARTVR